MEFKTLFNVLKKHLSGSDDVPYFFREIMALITTVKENEWGTKKDPNYKAPDNTLRTYAKRGPSKALAQKMLYRLTMENFENYINGHSEETLELMSIDFSTYDATANSSNIARKVTKWLTEIIHTLAGTAPASALAKQQQQQLSASLKSKYGDYLLHECSGYCPSLGCGKSLSVANNGALQYVYDISLIDKTGKQDVDNLIALCPRCYATYQIDTSPKTTNSLKNAKKYLSTRIHDLDSIDNIQLEKGLTDVIKKVVKLKEKDLASCILDPKEIKDKIDSSKNYILYADVKSKITTYYIKINDIMINLDKRGIIDYEELQTQMRSIYKRLSKTKKTDVEIFTEISEKIHKATLQDDIYCQIIVAYFIQRCEVFDAIAK